MTSDITLLSRRGPLHSRSWPDTARREDQGPDVGGAVGWLGADARLRALLHDHVHACGATLQDGPGSQLTVLDAGALDEHGPTGTPTSVPAPPSPQRIVLTHDGEEDLDLLHRALATGVRAVVALPSGSSRLLQLLGDLGRPSARAHCLGVVPGCPGADALAFAARLAAAARRHGDVVLVDADPWGPGIEHLVESAAVGLQWQDLPAGDVPGNAALRAALPRLDEVSLLGAGTGPTPPARTMMPVLRTLAGGEGTVVVGIAPDRAAELADAVDALLLLTESTEEAMLATARRLDAWGLPDDRLHLVVRRRAALSPQEVAGELGLRLAASYREGLGGSVPLLDVRRGGADGGARRALEAVRPR